MPSNKITDWGRLKHTCPMFSFPGDKPRTSLKHMYTEKKIFLQRRQDMNKKEFLTLY